MLSFLREIFVNQYWLVTVVCISLISIIKSRVHGKQYYVLGLFVPLICILISALFTSFLHITDQMQMSRLGKISHIVYHGLAPVGIYEVYKNIRRFIQYALNRDKLREL
jgi:Na+-translocating ferredoxin:NAD+ oxidoreductase RnfA subunit